MATGPIPIDVEYALHAAAAGSELHGSRIIRGSGLIGRVLAQATDALLAAGPLTSPSVESGVSSSPHLQPESQDLDGPQTNSS